MTDNEPNDNSREYDNPEHWKPMFEQKGVKAGVRLRFEGDDRVFVVVEVDEGLGGGDAYLDGQPNITKSFFIEDNLEVIK